jgi:hypothetical protein
VSEINWIQYRSWSTNATIHSLITRSSDCPCTKCFPSRISITPQVLWRSKHPLLNDHIRCEPLVEVRFMRLHIECRATRTPDKSRGRIRFHGGVSILCWSATSTVRSLSKLSIRDCPSSKPVWKRQSNKGYETNHSACEPVTICNRKQGHYSDRRICEMMIW